MNTLLANLLQTLNELAEHGRVFFDALSLHAPGSISAVAVLALCSTAAVVVLDASRRTLAVPTWSYLRRDIAQLAADRDGKRGLVDSLRAEFETLESQLEGLRAEKFHLTGLSEQREAQEAALRDLSERLASMEDDRALIDAIRAELDPLKSEQGALQQQIADLQAERSEHESNLKRLREHESKLEHEVSALKASREATNTHLNQMKLESETLSRHMGARGRLYGKPSRNPEVRAMPWTRFGASASGWMDRQPRCRAASSNSTASGRTWKPELESREAAGRGSSKRKAGWRLTAARSGWSSSPCKKGVTRRPVKPPPAKRGCGNSGSSAMRFTAKSRC